jgi:hypothetical protein
MVAYSTNEPFVLEQLGAAFRTFSPAAYGADFYGDNLCTSEAEVKARPERVAAFRAASLEGWAYALEHKEATVDLILKTYSAKKSHEALLFEAAHTDLLVRRRAGHIGQQDAEHWRKIATTYRKLGLLADDTLPAGLMWSREDDIEGRWLIPLLLAPVGLAIAALVAYRSRRSLQGALARLGALTPAARMGRPRLSLVMSLPFIGLSIRCGRLVNRSELPVRAFVLLAFVADLIAPPVRDLFEGLGSLCKNGDLVRYRLIAPDDNVDVEWVEFNAAAYPPCILGSN